MIWIQNMNSCTRKARILRYLFVRIQKQCKGLRNKIWTWIVLSPNSTLPPPPSVAIHFSSVFIYIKLSFSTQTHISSIFIYNDSCSFQNIPIKISSRRVDEEMRMGFKTRTCGVCHNLDSSSPWPFPAHLQHTLWGGRAHWSSLSL